MSEKQEELPTPREVLLQIDQIMGEMVKRYTLPIEQSTPLTEDMQALAAAIQFLVRYIHKGTQWPGSFLG